MAYGLKYEELEGRKFTHVGDIDCFRLCIDFFDLNFGIKIPNFARPRDWESDSMDLIRTLHEKAGFDIYPEWKPKDLHPADVLALSIGEANPNHLAIYLGDDEIFHHMAGRFSRREPLHGFWRNHTSFILRHPDVPDLRPVGATQDLMEFLRARNASPTPR
jgi:cell wall-associated NlpC family hydrolase